MLDLETRDMSTFAWSGTAHSIPQGYYSNVVKASGKSTAPALAPAAAECREVAGGRM